MPQLLDHDLRYALTNELHARPFPVLTAPCRAVFLAIKRPSNAAGRDRGADRAHLLALLDRHGTAHPAPDATHFSGQIGKHILKWESHTEFVTYTVFLDDLGVRAFDPEDFNVFPADWLGEAPGVRISSMLIRVEHQIDDGDISAKLDQWFVPESLAVSAVLDGAALIASDFRIDMAGHTRMAVFARPDTGVRRIGRVVQRATEIEYYKTMSMLGLARVRTLSAPLGALDGQLTSLISGLTGTDAEAEDTLTALLSISAELETHVTQAAFRFGATGAYEALVNQRIEILRETRFQGRQTLAEFMMRRFDPAMRTVKATQARLNQMADRAKRAGDLLRTRVDVERSAQNQKLLTSMDARAALQLRLQTTVEGLSVVAISYYAVNLATYLTYPLAASLGTSKTLLTSILTLPVVAIVFWMVHRIRHKIE